MKSETLEEEQEQKQKEEEEGGVGVGWKSIDLVLLQRFNLSLIGIALRHQWIVSELRNYFHIDAAIEYFNSSINRATGVVSVAANEFHCVIIQITALTQQLMASIASSIDLKSNQPVIGR